MLAALLALTLAAPVPKDQTPPGPPPKLYYVRAIGNANSVRIYVPQPAVVGNFVARVNTATVESVGGKIVAVDPKAVTAEQSIARLREGTVVVMSPDGKELHPIYRAALAPDALVLTLPGAEKGMYPIMFYRNNAPVPTLVLLKVDADGKTRVPVLVAYQEKVKIVANIVANGAVVPQEREGFRMVQKSELKLLEGLNATLSTAGGAAATPNDLAKGGLAILSANGQPVDSLYLKAFAKETPVILVPPTLSPALPVAPAKKD